MPEALSALHTFMSTNHVSARDVFNAVDADRSGYLELSELRSMVRKLAGANAKPVQIRQMLASIVAADTRGADKMSYRDLLRGRDWRRIMFFFHVIRCTLQTPSFLDLKISPDDARLYCAGCVC